MPRTQPTEQVSVPAPAPILAPLDDEIVEFESNVRRFRAGEIDNAEFRPWRLTRGVYGQRQPDGQMVRVKLPAGGVTADQMDTFADIAERFTGLGRGHLTTRQNIQLHFVQLEDVPEVLQMLARVGLTTREACGNVVRNVTACPYAGVSTHEAFDVTPYLAAYARRFLRNPVSQNLPRKFKTAFSCGPDDCAGASFHDLGFIARVRRDASGRELRGFELRAGGGTSTMPWRAAPLYEFVTADDGRYLVVAEAVIRVFAREGDIPGLLRKNKNKARLKFLLREVGIDSFRRLVEEELAGEWARRMPDMASLAALAPEGPCVAPPALDGGGVPPGFERWRQTNVVPQRQPGYCAVAVTVPVGNLSGTQFRRLAQIMRVYCGGHARTNQAQDLVLRWVPEAALGALYRELAADGLGDAEAGLLADVVSCPGASTCSLAITASQSLGEALNRFLREHGPDDELSRQVYVKISGCPNGCGQHHLGAIGLQGTSMHGPYGVTIPAYDVFVGGDNYRGARRYAERVARVAAKRVPQAILALLERYRAERGPSEGFVAYVERVGAQHLAPVLEPFASVGPVHEDLDAYVDWGAREPFRVVRGEGECAV